MSKLDSSTTCKAVAVVMVQKLLIRHILDTMHCEKNLCENMVKIVFGMKDNYGSREVMKNHGIWRQLWLQPHHSKRELFHMPGAPYTLTSTEKTSVLEIIKNLRTPSNYVGTIQKCLADGKLRYMKSHDFHVLMHQVLYKLWFCILGGLRKIK
jgi:hypothetical protein